MMNESSGLFARLVTLDVEEKSGQVVAKNGPTKTDESREKGGASPRDEGDGKRDETGIK